MSDDAPPFLRCQTCGQPLKSEALAVLRELVREFDHPSDNPRADHIKRWDAAWERARALLASEVSQNGSTRDH